MQFNTAFSKRFEQGMSLIELMIAMLLGLVLTAGMIQIFVGNNQSYRLQDASSAAQESGRFAMDFLEKDLRMTSFMGCTGYSSANVNNDINTGAINALAVSTVGNFIGPGALRGYTYSGSFPNDLTLLGLSSSQVVQGTDIIVMEYAASCPGGNLVCDNASASGSITCPNGSTINPGQYEIADNGVCNVHAGDVVLLADCQNVDIHVVTNPSNPAVTSNAIIDEANSYNNSGNQNQSSPMRAYSSGAMLYKMSAVVYYVGFSPTGEPALFRHYFLGSTFTVSSPLGLSNSDEELVDGVYSMTVLYGVDTDGDTVPNNYQTATVVGTPANWNNQSTWDSVVTVRITLNTRSPQDNVTPTSQTYTYNGSSVTDRRLRRSFTATMALRNRI